MAATLRLEAFLPYRLNRLAAEVSRQLQRDYKRAFGLTVPEWRVVATLGQLGPLTATAIGAHSSMHKTKVSRAIASLERRRWVAREENPADRREAFAGLTSTGQGVYKRLIEIALGFERGLLGGLAPEDLEAVENALAVLEERLLRRSGEG